MDSTPPDRIRLTISVTPEVHETFSRMAEASGVSLGRCMGDWLADTAEGAQFVAQKMVEARKAPKTLMREMRSMAVGLVELTDETLEGMRAPRRSGASLASHGPARGTPAPSSNTGLNPPTRPTTRGRK